MASPGMVDRFLAASDFEVSSSKWTPLAVWYNGLLDACDNSAKVLARLK